MPSSRTDPASATPTKSRSRRLLFHASRPPWCPRVSTPSRLLARCTRAGLYPRQICFTEQRPRMQSRVEVDPIRHEDRVISPVDHRPVPGAKRTHRTCIRHGVTEFVPGRGIPSASFSTIRPDSTQFSEVHCPSQRNSATPRSAAPRKRPAGTD